MLVSPAIQVNPAEPDDDHWRVLINPLKTASFVRVARATLTNEAVLRGFISTLQWSSSGSAGLTWIAGLTSISARMDVKSMMNKIQFSRLSSLITYTIHHMYKWFIVLIC